MPRGARRAGSRATATATRPTARRNGARRADRGRVRGVGAMAGPAASGAGVPATAAGAVGPPGVIRIRPTVAVPGACGIWLSSDLMSDRFLTDTDREPPGRRHPPRGRHPRSRDGDPSADARPTSSRLVRRPRPGDGTAPPRTATGRSSRPDRGRDARARHVCNHRSGGQVARASHDRRRRRHPWPRHRPGPCAAVLDMTCADLVPKSNRSRNPGRGDSIKLAGDLRPTRA